MRPKDTTPKVQQIVMMPEPLRDAMRNSLFDEERGRVPGNSISKYICGLIKRDLADRKAIPLTGLLEQPHDGQ